MSRHNSFEIEIEEILLKIIDYINI